MHHRIRTRGKISILHTGTAKKGAFLIKIKTQNFDQAELLCFLLVIETPTLAYLNIILRKQLS